MTFGIEAGKRRAAAIGERNCREAEAEAFVDAELKEQKKQADLLIEIAKRGELFHTPDGVAYADIQRDEHRETYPVKSGGFERWLRLRFYNEHDKSTPNKDAIASAIGTIEAIACFEGDKHPVAVRIGGHDGKIYLDLCNDDWQAIEIDADGWRSVDEPPIRFIRASGMLPLPLPKREGKTKDCINSLRQFINIKEGDDFALLKAWVLSAFYDHGPYPVLALIAQHGAAKSTILKILRALIDPNDADLRSPPRCADDLYITAIKSLVVMIDNLSSIPEWLSDALCRIATGMSYAKRMLYKDQDEVLIRATRPIALTSVVEVIEAPDLGDRAIMLVPPKIVDGTRREEAEVLASFEEVRPAILAAFLDAMSHGLKTLPDVKEADLPRMADFAKWAIACEGAHDMPGTFLKAYRENHHRAARSMLGDNIIASMLQQLAMPWSGNSQTLLYDLAQLAGDHAKSADWPKTPKKLSNIVRRLIPPLAEVGIEVEPPADTDKTRTWRISRAPTRPPKRPEQPDDNPLKNRGLGGVGGTLHTSGNGEPPKGNGQIATVSKQPPEQPDSPDANKSGNGANGLGPSAAAGGSQADKDDRHEPPAHDIPDFLDRRGELNCTVCGKPTDGSVAIGGEYFHEDCFNQKEKNSD